MNPVATFERRAHTAQGPFPARVSTPEWCPHGAGPYCGACTPEGLVIHSNRDIESSSWWLYAPQGAA